MHFLIKTCGVVSNGKFRKNKYKVKVCVRYGTEDEDGYEK